MSCKHCDGPLGKENKTGLCRKCWPKFGFNILRAQDPEGWRQKRSEAIKRNYMENPARLDAARETMRRIAKLPQSIAARSAKAKELRIWEMGTAAQPAGSESRKRMGKKLQRARLSWCPPELIPEYKHLTRSLRMSAADAKRAILDLQEAKIRRLRASMGATGDANPVAVLPREGNDNAVETGTYERAEVHKAEKARIDALRVDRRVCPICATRSDIGCKHSEAA